MGPDPHINENGTWSSINGGNSGTWTNEFGTGTWVKTTGTGGTGVGTWVVTTDRAGTWSSNTGSGTWSSYAWSSTALNTGGWRNGVGGANDMRHTTGRVVVSTIKENLVAGSITNVKTLKVSNQVDDKSTKVWFRGEMNPGSNAVDGPVKAYFRYSSVDPGEVAPIFCNDIYGSNMQATDDVLVEGNTIQAVGILEGSLTPNTTYYYCVVGSSIYFSDSSTIFLIMVLFFRKF